MQMLGTMLVAGGVLLTAGGAIAGETKEDTRNTGKTFLRGTSGVGKGGSKIYHDAAGKFHKLIAKNSKSRRTKALHMSKSHAHHGHATRKAVQSKREMDKAERHADAVGK